MNFEDEFDLPQEIIDEVTKPFTILKWVHATYVVPTTEKPIKIAYESPWKFTSVDEYTVELSRPLTEEEKQALIDLINDVKGE